MFKSFAQAVETRFNHMSMCELFKVEAPDIYDAYLASFPEGTNPIYKTRTEHDCQCCKQFIRNIGNVVSIVDGKMMTVWGGHNGLDYPYDKVSHALDEYVKARPIVSVFRTGETKYGNDHNYDVNNQRYDHFVGHIAARHRPRDVDTDRGEKNTLFQVLKRGLTTIKLSDIETVLDLIDSNALYRGEEHRTSIIGFKQLLEQYTDDLFVWSNIGSPFAKFRNTVIGTLLVDLSEGKDIEDAVKSFETKVAPMNYKRPTSIITQKMVEQAVETLNNLGLGGAIYRRYAKLSDVSVNDVLFVDNSASGKMKDGIAAILEDSVRRTVSVNNPVEIAADEFIEQVLPKATTVHVLVENKHCGNFVSLTAPNDEGAKLFKWDNNFAWSYDGDTTDSVKQRVKAAGGNITADLRVSLSWFNFDDLDLHAQCPLGHIYFGNKGRILDVDMNVGIELTRTPVENLSFISPKDGNYAIVVHQYNQRETVDFGFEIEIEMDGVLRQFSHKKSLRRGEQADCFAFTISNGKLTNFKLGQNLVEGSSSQDKWGVKTETLVPVTSVMYSPNYWGDQKVGAKHLIFALKDCKNPGDIRGVYNEFLRNDLVPHRKVFEVLGSKTKCKYSDEQISGLGFTAARGDSVNVVVNNGKGYCIKF